MTLLLGIIGVRLGHYMDGKTTEENAVDSGRRVYKKSMTAFQN